MEEHVPTAFYRDLLESRVDTYLPSASVATVGRTYDHPHRAY